MQLLGVNTPRIMPQSPFINNLIPKQKIIDVEVLEYPVAATVVVDKPERKQFIEANSKETTSQHLKSDCVVPVFSKDNELTISHTNFIETIYQAACNFFKNETITQPDIRVSHVIKGRVPEAIHKPVHQLLDSDKTIYYERMAFCFEIPTITETIDGNKLNLTIGGVRAYNHEKLHSKKTSEKFKIFIGFKNLVCCNMCISTDGYMSEARAMSSIDLQNAAIKLFQRYNPFNHLHSLTPLQHSYLSEHQFAQFIGKSRLYQFLPQEQKKLIPPMLLTDTQINLVAKAYYQDEDFAITEDNTNISLWKVYNLLTGANKSSYIDNFLDRSVNTSQLITGINQALKGNNAYSWFID